MPIMHVILLNERRDSFHRQAIKLKLYFNPSSDSCIKTHNTGAGGVGATVGEKISQTSITMQQHLQCVVLTP